MSFDDLLEKLKNLSHRVVVCAPQRHYQLALDFCKTNHINHIGYDLERMNKQSTSIHLKEDTHQWVLFTMTNYKGNLSDSFIQGFGNGFTDMIYIYLNWEHPYQPQIMGMAIRTRSHGQPLKTTLKTIHMVGLERGLTN